MCRALLIHTLNMKNKEVKQQIEEQKSDVTEVDTGLEHHTKKGNDDSSCCVTWKPCRTVL